jgi:hypothetical protein
LSSSRPNDSKKDYNNKIYVGGLVEVLNQVSEGDIRQVSDAFN